MRQINPRAQHLTLSLRIRRGGAGACALRRGWRGRLWAGLGPSSVLGPRRCGRSRRPHRGNRSAAAPPCRPLDCHRLWVWGYFGHRPRKQLRRFSQIPPSSPSCRRRRHARGGRQIPQKVTTPQGSALPSFPGPEDILRGPWVGFEMSLGKARSLEEGWKTGKSHGKERGKVHWEKRTGPFGGARLPSLLPGSAGP